MRVVGCVSALTLFLVGKEKDVKQVYRCVSIERVWLQSVQRVTTTKRNEIARFPLYIPDFTRNKLEPNQANRTTDEFAA